MLGTTHALVTMVVAALIYWKMPEKVRPNHGRFMLFALFAGVLVDFDFLSGFLELAFTGSIPPTLQQFISEGRQNHPVFTHSIITLGIAMVASVVGLSLFLRDRSNHFEYRGKKPITGRYQGIVTSITFGATITPQLLLRLHSSHWWGIDDPQLWTVNVTLAGVFLAGIIVGILVNIRRPAYLLVFGLGISLHLLCDMIQYFVLVLGAFDPAWAAGIPPLRIGLDLYSDSDILLGAVVEGPAYAFFIIYIAWYFLRGKEKRK